MSTIMLDISSASIGLALLSIIIFPVARAGCCS
jgi:hypothetical protein